MRMTRTFVDTVLSPGQVIHLPESASVHLVRVLRLGLGDACVLFNGDGSDYEARLVAVPKRGAQAEVMRQLVATPESPLRTVLAQAIARGEKMDWVLQKATELGVSAIVPLVTERTEVKLDAERGEKRMAHWRGVMTAACEQSGRARVPRIAAPCSLADWLATVTQPGWYLDPQGDSGAQQIAPDGEIALVVGPEGGLGERDLSLLRAAGFRGLRLGPRVLRTETAGIAALAAIQSLHGDLR
jgi:16S rRNA (uracil1498-N3)-methyltransferase